MNPYYPPDLPFPLVRAWYEAFAERTSLPLFLFNTPYSGTSLTVDEIAELAEIDIVCGIKNPRGREHLLALQARLGDRIVVADAAERDWLDLHSTHGFQALMSTPALALYQTPGNLPIVEYTPDGGSRTHDRLGPARDVFEKWMRRPWLDGARDPDRAVQGVAGPARPAAGARPRTAGAAQRGAQACSAHDLESLGFPANPCGAGVRGDRWTPRTGSRAPSASAPRVRRTTNSCA